MKYNYHTKESLYTSTRQSKLRIMNKSKKAIYESNSATLYSIEKVANEPEIKVLRPVMSFASE